MPQHCSQFNVPPAGRRVGEFLQTGHRESGQKVEGKLPKHVCRKREPPNVKMLILRKSGTSWTVWSLRSPQTGLTPASVSPYREPLTVAFRFGCCLFFLEWNFMALHHYRLPEGKVFLTSFTLAFGGGQIFTKMSWSTLSTASLLSTWNVIPFVSTRTTTSEWCLQV